MLFLWFLLQVLTFTSIDFFFVFLCECFLKYKHWHELSALFFPVDNLLDGFQSLFLSVCSSYFCDVCCGNL